MREEDDPESTASRRAPGLEAHGEFEPKPELKTRRAVDPGLVIAAVAFVLYAWGASPAHAWLDAGEIGAAGAELGVMHPTGVPGLAHLLQLSCALPIGTLGFRMSLASGVMAALSLWLLSRIFARRGGGWATSLSCCLWLALGLTFSRQARVVEIYAYASCLLAVILHSFDPLAGKEAEAAGSAEAAGEKGQLHSRLVGVGAAVLGAWSFGDMRLAFALPVALAWGFAFRKRAVWARHAPWVVVAASLPVFALALSSARAPLADWGDPDALRRLWEHVNASSIREAFGGQILPSRWLPWAHESGRAFERLTQDIGPFGPLCVLISALALWRDRAARPWLWILLALLCVEWVYTVGVNPMGGVDRQTGIPLAMLSVTLVGCALAPLEGRAGRLRWAALPVAAALLWLSPGLRSAQDLSLTRSWGPHLWTRAALAQLPPGAALLTVSDDLASGWRAAQTLEGARPDLFVHPAQHLYRAVPDAARRQSPQIQAALDAAYQGCTEAERAQAFARAWTGPATGAGSGPVYVENPGLEMVRALPADLSTPLPLGRVLGEDEEGSAMSGAKLRAVVNRSLAVATASGRLEHPEDLRRVATAVSARVRAWLDGRADDPAAVAAAIAAYREVIQRTGVQLPSTLVSLGALVDRQGQGELAIELTQRALTLDPRRRLALMNLALYLSRQPDRGDEAIELAREAVQLYPSHVAAWRRLAQVCGSLSDELCVQEAVQGQAAAAEMRGSGPVHPSCQR